MINLLANSARRVPVPIAVYPGIALTGASVKQIVTDARAQYEAVAALQQRFQMPVVLSAMDLSAEAEAFGAEIRLTDDEIPTVIGRRVTKVEDFATLSIPQPGDARTRVHLEAVQLMTHLPGHPLVLGGIIGPFSLAARLFGMSETLELSVHDPDALHPLLERTAQFLIAYGQAFKQSGADGLVMAEPAAGLLSPRALGRFSSAYVRRVVHTLKDDHFDIVLHNCAARMVHLKYVLESDATLLHFGEPMDIGVALTQAPENVVIMGNLDPSRIFVSSTPDQVQVAVRQLLTAANGHRNFAPSSGCDLPPDTVLQNLEAFFAAVRDDPRPPSVAA
jgi:uroporphyrinogen decarboxylase